MSVKRTMQYIEQNKETYLSKKNKHKFVCSHCLKEFDVELKAPYVSNEDEDSLYCQPCIDRYYETSEW